MTSQPAFPAPRNAPTAPAFGWILSPLRLTVNEAQEVEAQCGRNPLDMEGISGPDALRVGMHVALAYARRLDPDAYPWEMAGLIPMDQLRKRFPDQDQEDESIARQVERAIEAGEVAPDPS